MLRKDAVSRIKIRITDTRTIKFTYQEKSKLVNQKFHSNSTSWVKAIH